MASLGDVFCGSFVVVPGDSESLPRFSTATSTPEATENTHLKVDHAVPKAGNKRQTQLRPAMTKDPESMRPLQSRETAVSAKVWMC